MSKKLIAFGASNSRQSINKQLANFAANQIEDAEVHLLDLNDFEMPIYSSDREREGSIPEEAQNFSKAIEEADGIVVSFAEHNGSYSAAYKNIYDWASRVRKNVWMDKPMFLLATSPGARGGQAVLGAALTTYSYANKNTIASFSLPEFQKNFSEEGINNSELKEKFQEQLNIFAGAL